MLNMREKASRCCEAAPTLRRSAVRGYSPPQAPTIKPSTWLKQGHSQETCQASDHCPSSKSSPVKLRYSKISLRPCHILRNGGNNFSGERRDRGSTLLPWKYDGGRGLQCFPIRGLYYFRNSSFL